MCHCPCFSSFMTVKGIKHLIFPLTFTLYILCQYFSFPTPYFSLFLCTSTKVAAGKKMVMKKGSWTPDEDHKLVSYVERNGPRDWRALPSKAGLQRCGKSCRLRWTNYLRPDIKRGKFNDEEEETIIRLHALLGNKWSMIANHLFKRTDNEIKNYWNTHIKKKLIKMGIDPVSHRRRSDGFGVNLSHMTQWENARLEAEGRLMLKTIKHATSPNQLVVKKKKSPQHVDKPKLSPIIPLPGIMSDLCNRNSLDSPTSTLSFLNNTPTIPKAGFLDNQFMPLFHDITSMCDEGVMMMAQNIKNDAMIVESSFMPPMINEMEKSIMKDDFTKFIDVTNKHNLIANNNYTSLEVSWNSILNNLANSSPLGSVCFLN